MPDASSRRSKPDKLPLNQVDVPHRADIHKVFEADVAEPQGLDFKGYSLGLLRAVEPNESVLQAGLVYLLLGFFLVADELDALGLLQKVVVEIPLQHQVVVVDLLKLSHEVLLPDDQLNHFLSDRLSDLFNDTLEHDLAVVLLEDRLNVVEDLIARNR